MKKSSKKVEGPILHDLAEMLSGIAVLLKDPAFPTKKRARKEALASCIKFMRTAERTLLHQTQQCKGAPLTLDDYVIAGRASLERVIEMAAKMEQAVDLEPGTFLHGELSYLEEENADDLVCRIEDAYEFKSKSKSQPRGWRKKIAAIVAEHAESEVKS